MASVPGSKITTGVTNEQTNKQTGVIAIPADRGDTKETFVWSLFGDTDSLGGQLDRTQLCVA